MREAAGGGIAWISSFTKRAAPGSTIDIPLAHKDALYVRSHYDGISITLPDAPLPDELAIICAYANRGQLNHRIGGLAATEISRARTASSRAHLLPPPHAGIESPSDTSTGAPPCPSTAPCKTGAEHLASLRDGRNVYHQRQEGRRRHDASRIPQLMPVRRRALRFPGAAGKPGDDDVPARRRHAAHQSARGRCRASSTRWSGAARHCRRGPACSYGFLGRSPDHLASVLVGQSVGMDVWNKYDPKRAKAVAGLLRVVHSRNDLFLTYVIINPQADRSKDGGEQVDELLAPRSSTRTRRGITIRGAKMLGTGGDHGERGVRRPSFSRLKPGDEKLAFSCALPMNANGSQDPVAQDPTSSTQSRLRQSAVQPLRRERRAALLRRRQGAVGPRVRHRNVEMCQKQFHAHARARLPELPGADPALGEAEVPGRRSPHDRRR